MYRLVHDLARERLLYARPQSTLPDIMLIDVPAGFAHPSLPLGRYYPILIETQAERDLLEAYLTAPRSGPVRPDLFDRRPSALTASCITMAAYPPPAPGWPWLLLCHWPRADVACSADPDMFARGAYTIEAFDSVTILRLACERLLSTLSEHAEVDLRLIAPSTGFIGRA